MSWELIKDLAGDAPAPVGTALVIGAGGPTTVRAMRGLHADRLVLVEANPVLAAGLRRQARADRGEQVLEQAATAAPGDAAVLHVLNHQRYSSLPAPAALGKYFPNVRGSRQVEVRAEPIVDLVAKLGLDKDAGNLLVLDVPGQASTLLENLPSADLQRFARIVVRCSEIPLYEGEAPAREVLARLEKTGFDVDGEDPRAVFPERVLLLSRNASRIEVERLALELQRERSERAGLSAELEALGHDLELARQQVREREARLDKLAAALEAESGLRASQARQLESMAGDLSRVASLRADLDGLQRQLGTLVDGIGKSGAAALAEQRLQAERLDRLASTVEGVAQQASLEALAQEVEASRDRLSRGLTKSTKRAIDAISQDVGALVQAVEGTIEKTSGDSIQELTKAIKLLVRDLSRKVDRSTTNAAKQVQAYLGVHEYLRSGDLPSLSTEGHAWPISPDFAALLVELMELNDYDAVIEFGSGYSTVIMARVLARRAEADPGEQPVDLVSFEHLEKYLARTANLLEHAGVTRFSRLVHAPLEEYEAPNGSVYPYYRCVETIDELGRRHGEGRPRVLVVVDGPPGKTGRHARYPAAPIVLSAFACGRFDFLMDDFGRADEKEIVDLWQQELSAAGVEHEALILPLDKDACLLRVDLGPRDGPGNE